MDSQDVTTNRGYRALVSVGLVSYGLVHVVMAWIALRLAWGGGGGEASSQGALQELAGQPLGSVLLGVVAIGLFALVVWQGFEAALGHRHLKDAKRLRKRVSSAGKALVYLALGLSAAMIALGGGGGGGGGGGNTEESVTARLLAVPFGRVLVVLVGLVVVAVGVAQIVKGVKKKFTEELAGGADQPTVRLGTAGYVAKGIALAIVGGLFGWAALTYDADKAGGIDAALKTVQDQPFGGILLTVMALGILAFGLYCFSWARQARH